MDNECKEANVIRITQGDLESIINRKDAIEQFNTKLRILREQSMYDSLTQATKLRLDMMAKAKTWIDMLEKRIFDPDVIRELDISKVISLMKFVSNVTLRLLAQMNDIEKIFKTYVESTLASSSVMKGMDQNRPMQSEEEKNVKDMLMKALTDAIKCNATDVDVRKVEIVEGKATPDLAIDGLSDVMKDIENLDVELEKDIL
jgi:hypothetical protein